VIFKTPSGARLSIDENSRPDGLTLPLDEANRPAIQAWVDARYPVVQPPLFQTAASAIAAMRDWIEAAEEQIDGGVSQGERDSYLAKEAEARAWVADNQAPTPILSAEAAVTGESLADLTAKVIAKADALRPIMGEIAGLRRATEMALLAAEADTANTDPFKFDTILTAAQTQAVQLAAARGITLAA
jgi:hypothetical protein